MIGVPEIERALIAEFMRKNRYMTLNYYFRFYECDLLLVTNSGYLTEYEIKVSRGDFFKDAKKVEKRFRAWRSCRT